jgi:crotonobetainyl-CoA:carnitine CoA-transferase CaiB-like acyl-CoA transferase
VDWRSGRLPLKGLRVIDWSVYWAGPYLGMMLHDLGAEVIKIESPSNWDPMRTVIDVNKYAGANAKPLTAQERSNTNQHYNEWNRGKRSFAVELKEQRGRELFLRLAAQSHIVIENHRPGAKEKLGIADEDVRAVRPDVIYLSLSGFGQTRPERDAMALGAPVELASGLFSLNGYRDSETPAKTGFSYGDPVGALAAVSAVLLAVRQRRKTGQGRYIDISMRDALAFGIGSAFVDWSANGIERPRRGNRHPSFAPQGVYRAKRPPSAALEAGDEWVAISVRDDADWRMLAAVIDANASLNVESRREQHDEIDATIEAWTSQREAREIESTLQGAGVPCTAVLDYPQLAADPQLAARGAFQKIEHPVFGTEVRSSNQWQRGEDPQPVGAPAPCFGADNRYVLGEVIGLTPDEIDAVERDGVIGNEILAPAE